MTASEVDPTPHPHPQDGAVGRSATITVTARDGSRRRLKRYTAIGYDVPGGCAAGYLPEMNVPVAASDYSRRSDQPLMKNIRVRVAPSAEG